MVIMHFACNLSLMLFHSMNSQCVVFLVFWWFFFFGNMLSTFVGSLNILSCSRITFTKASRKYQSVSDCLGCLHVSSELESEIFLQVQQGFEFWGGWSLKWRRGNTIWSLDRRRLPLWTPMRSIRGTQGD